MGKEAWTHWPASALGRGVGECPKYIQQGLPWSSPSPSYWGNLGGWGRRKSIHVRVSRVFFKGPLVTQLVILPSSQREWKIGGEGEGGTGKAFKQLQLPDMCPHLCSVF